MPDAPDMDLLQEFVRHHSEPAFAELVRRHLNLVYSVALRTTACPGDAEDVAQAVFILLARKAAGLNDRTVLTGWLYETTRLTAAGWWRTQRRRQAHEQEAYMQSTLDPAGTDHLWRQLAPHLEAAMARLNEKERTLLALRFYEHKTGAEAAAQLGIREQAAHKRTARALEKLRKIFAERGVDSTTALLAGAISANAVAVAPAGLAATISAAASTIAGTAVTTTIIMTTLQKIAVTAALTVVVGVGIYQAKQAANARAEVQTLQQQQAPLAEQVQQLQKERDRATKAIAWLNEKLAENSANNLELLKLRGTIGNMESEAGKLKEENNKLKSRTTGNLNEVILPLKDVFAFHSFVAINSAKEVAMALRCYEKMYGAFPTNFNQELVDYYNHHIAKTLSVGKNGLEVFEMVPNVNLTGLNGDTTNIIMIRERQARQTTDGRWERVYAFTDGTAQAVISENDGFLDWESMHLPGVH